MKLIRDASKVLTTVKEVNNQLIALQPCSIQIPKRFIERNLAIIGTDVFIFGYYALLYNEYYMVSKVPAMINIMPYKILDIIVDKKEYLNFIFKAGQAIIVDMNVVKREPAIFNIVDEFIIKGNIPWYITYDDLGQFMEHAKEYASSNVGAIAETIEILASMISRSAEDPSKYFRTLDNYTAKPKYISLNNVYYASTNALNKLAGNYFSDGITSALVNKTDTVERIEELLRI